MIDGHQHPNTPVLIVGTNDGDHCTKHVYTVVAAHLFRCTDWPYWVKLFPRLDVLGWLALIVCNSSYLHSKPNALTTAILID